MRLSHARGGSRRSTIRLVEGASRILPTFAESLSQKASARLVKMGMEIRANARVERVDAEGMVVGGERMMSRTVLWTAGVTLSPERGPVSALHVARRRSICGSGAFCHAVRVRRTCGAPHWRLIIRKEIEFMGATIQAAQPATAGAASQIMPSDALVFFGATGDLAYKKIFPALQHLIRRGTLAAPVIGVAKSGWTIDQLRERARDSLEQHGGGVDEAAFTQLVQWLRYVDGDYHDPATFDRLRHALGRAA